jgi:hypothetical protein
VSGDNNDYAGAVKATQWERAPSISATRPTTPNRDWAELVLTEMEVFPKGRYDDLTDSTTQAIRYLRDNGLLRSDQEEHVWAMDGVRHKPRPKPLYPC